MLKALKFKTGFYVKKSACTRVIHFRQEQVLSIDCLHHLFFFGLQSWSNAPRHSKIDLFSSDHELRQCHSFELRCSLDLLSSYQKD